MLVVFTYPLLVEVESASSPIAINVRLTCSLLSESPSSSEKAFTTEDGDCAADEGDSDNEEHVNLALMAIGD